MSYIFLLAITDGIKKSNWDTTTIAIVIAYVRVYLQLWKTTLSHPYPSMRIRYSC